MRRLTHITVLAAFVFSCGGQWYALQCIAWVKMLHEYAQMVPLSEAVSMTFSGQYPCEICKAIAEKKQSQKDQSFALEKYDKKFLPTVAVAVPRPQVVTLRYATNSISLQFRADAPPTPPPRFLPG